MTKRRLRKSEKFAIELLEKIAVTLEEVVDNNDVPMERRLEAGRAAIDAIALQYKMTGTECYVYTSDDYRMFA